VAVAATESIRAVAGFNRERAAEFNSKPLGMRRGVLFCRRRSSLHRTRGRDFGDDFGDDFGRHIRDMNAPRPFDAG
jgi:hypothetical protein